MDILHGREHMAPRFFVRKPAAVGQTRAILFLDRVESVLAVDTLAWRPSNGRFDALNGCSVLGSLFYDRLPEWRYK
jgi:hypothetical protein